MEYAFSHEQLYSTQLIEFLKAHERLLYIQYNDLFVRDYLSLIPEEWYKDLRPLTFQQMVDLTEQREELAKQLKSESLIAFIKEALALQEALP